MKVHILQHTSNTTPGSTLGWLAQENISYQITKFFEPHPVLPEFSSFDLLIICGGEMDVDQEDRYPWLKAEKEFIKKSIEQKKKVLGLCLGGQLMAEVLGGRVGKHPQWEVGWIPIRLKATSPFRMPMTSQLLGFQFHGYSFETPPGAFHFASSEACTHQGFLWGDRAIGLQFHPESTKDWVQTCATEKLPEGKFVQTGPQMIEGNKNQAALQSWYFNLLTNLKNT